MGLWMFDLSERQMVQSSASMLLLAPLFATEGSAQQCAHLVMLCVCMVFSKPNQFVIPVVVSVFATYSASIILNLAACLKSTNQDVDSDSELTSSQADHGSD